ncbi:MAG: hypothetical protein AABY22_01865 [Nanoarchaeota archaeon]
MKKQKARPKEIYLITDPLDGPHLFRTKKEAINILKQWHKEAIKNGYSDDSYWEMTGPHKYIFSK